MRRVYVSMYAQMPDVSGFVPAAYKISSRRTPGSVSNETESVAVSHVPSAGVDICRVPVIVDTTS